MCSRKSERKRYIYIYVMGRKREIKINKNRLTQCVYGGTSVVGTKTA